jgi:hypothetical protein
MYIWYQGMISDYLKHKGWTIMHIMDTGKSEEHPYTKPARIMGNNLVYSKK